jgi:hypothetical protein
MPEDPIKQAMASAGGFTLADENTTETTETTEGTESTETTETQSETQGSTEATETTETTEKTEVTKSPETTETTESSESASGDKVIPEIKGQEGGNEFEKLLAEKSNGRFKTLSDIDQALEKAPEEAFANPQVAKLNEYLKQGGTFEDFARTQTVNYQDMSDVDVIKEGYRLSDPNLTQEEINLLAEEEYGVAEGATERDKQLAQIRLKRDATKSRGALVEHQSKWAVPQASAEDISAAQQAEAERWVTNLSSTVDKVEKVDFVLNEKDTFPFQVSAEVKDAIKKDYADLGKFFLRYRNDDGSENIEAFVRDMIILNNYDNILKSAASYNKSQGREDVIKDIKNPDFKGKDATDKSSVGKGSIQDQALRAFYGRK